ncbi:MAG TPA: DUF3159 domain-containing protein [Actinotalea sp.]|nr:DUF3159 domain-containing protein [Actinotalea sp.]
MSEEPPATEPAAEPAAGASAGAPLRGVRALTADDFSFADAIGGVRGLVESTAPGLVFVVVFLVTGELAPALVCSASLAALAVLVRLAQRTPITQALSGLLGVGIGVVWAWRTGEAENYFAGGLIANAAYFLGTSISALVGWPLVGVVVSLLRSEPMTWRTDPEQSHLRRRYGWATWLWAAMFGARLAVQVPYYLQGEDGVGALGTAKLAMGVPLFAVTLWLTWLLVASPGARAERRGRRPSRPR